MIQLNEKKVCERLEFDLLNVKQTKKSFAQFFLYGTQEKRRFRKKNQKIPIW